MILHDRTLHGLALRLPQSSVELLTVPGIGQAKAERYGDAIIEIIMSQAGIDAALLND